jgi:hypothetical protein
MLDDGEALAHPFRELAADRLGQSRRRAGDRAGIGLEPEQARADLVVQLERGALALVVLRGDEPMVERLVFGARASCESSLGGRASGAPLPFFTAIRT